MIQRFRKVLTLAVIFCAFTSEAQQKPCYVITKSGNRVSGVSLNADANGTLTLKLDATGASTTFKRNQYTAAFVPRPDAVKQLESAFEKGKADLVLKYGPTILEKYKYLGWADVISYYYGMAVLKQNDSEKALKIFRQGRSFPGRHGDLLDMGSVSALLALEKYDQAAPILERMLNEADGEQAAFAFNARGDIEASRGNERDAVLEYLKTLLVFEPGVAEEYRNEAKQRVVSLLKEMGDARYKDFEKFE